MLLNQHEHNLLNEWIHKHIIFDGSNQMQYFHLKFYYYRLKHFADLAGSVPWLEICILDEYQMKYKVVHLDDSNGLIA